MSNKNIVLSARHRLPFGWQGWATFGLGDPVPVIHIGCGVLVRLVSAAMLPNIIEQSTTHEQAQEVIRKLDKIHIVQAVDLFEKYADAKRHVSKNRVVHYAQLLAEAEFVLKELGPENDD